MRAKVCEQYMYYDAIDSGKYDVLTPGSLAMQAVKFAEYVAYLEAEYPLAPGKEIVLTPLQHEVVQTARKFVEVLTGTATTCDVRVFTALYKDVVAHYSPQFDTIAVRDGEPSVFADNPYGFGRMLVHEMLHATAKDRITQLDIETHDSREIILLAPHQVEPSVTRATTCDYFFEEALAEQAASRWQEYVYPELANKDQVLKVNSEGIALPIRTYTALDSDTAHLPAAYATFGVQLLSEHLESNLFKLLLDARRCDGGVDAAIQLKQYVNSVEPELYELLMSAQYSGRDFKDCLAIIQQAIANQAHHQYKDQKLFTS